MQARKIQFRLEKREELSQEAEDESQEDVQIDPTDEDLEKIEPQRTTKEVSYYEARIKRCKANIEKEREKRSVSDEDPAVAYEKYKRAQNDLNAKVKQTEDLDKRIEELEKDMSQRRKRWHQFRKFLTRKTSDKFGEMLTMNDCSGDLEFDHEGKRLALAVQKGSSTADTQTKDVKALR
jgi:chromosome segregation ATPase